MNLWIRTIFVAVVVDFRFERWIWNHYIDAKHVNSGTIIQWSRLHSSFVWVFFCETLTHNTNFHCHCKSWLTFLTRQIAEINKVAFFVCCCCFFLLISFKSMLFNCYCGILIYVCLRWFFFIFLCGIVSHETYVSFEIAVKIFELCKMLRINEEKKTNALTDCLYDYGHWSMNGMPC